MHDDICVYVCVFVCVCVCVYSVNVYIMQMLYKQLSRYGGFSLSQSVI